MRLDKYLADLQVGTRKEIKEMIRKGLVTVNGEIEKDPGTSVSGEEGIICDGEPMEYQEYVYYMMNKPEGVITATEDSHQETVLDLLPERRRKDLFPVGRLDKDTKGLLLITNDGQLAHRLLSPKHHVEKTYEAWIEGLVTKLDVDRFARGVELEDFKAMPARLEILQTYVSQQDQMENKSYVRVTIHEGKFHQIKRMFEAQHKKVAALKRISMGPLTLDPDLPEGEFRELTPEEVAALKEVE
ncbi:MAG: pseudouridine synthase [Lachnospiraceae bacterium]|nr:pseudouridine synthase [Lachnospiraceae bacterium]